MHTNLDDADTAEDEIPDEDFVYTMVDDMLEEM